ncbi:hypothetical protein BDW72DRAFT_193260 [Aspergillus terricola var. indicus]
MYTYTPTSKFLVLAPIQSAPLAATNEQTETNVSSVRERSDSSSSTSSSTQLSRALHFKHELHYTHHAFIPTPRLNHGHDQGIPPPLRSPQSGLPLVSTPRPPPRDRSLLMEMHLTNGNQLCATQSFFPTDAGIFYSRTFQSYII